MLFSGHLHRMNAYNNSARLTFLQQQQQLGLFLLCPAHCSLLTVSCGHTGLGGLILVAACIMWMYSLWLQVSSTQQQMASEIQRLRHMQVTKFHHTCMPDSVNP